MTANPIAEVTIEEAANTNCANQYIIANRIIQHNTIDYEPKKYFIQFDLFFLGDVDKPAEQDSKNVWRNTSPCLNVVFFGIFSIIDTTVD